MTFDAVRPEFIEGDNEIRVQFAVSQGLAGVSAFDLVPGDGIIIDGVPGTGIDPFSTLLVAGSNVTVDYDEDERQWTINSSGGGGGGGGSTNLPVSTTSTTVTVAIDTGTDATLTAATGAAAGVMTAAMFTKLDGIASGATANSADATLLARANHTGTQAASTISDFSTAVDARIASVIDAAPESLNTLNELAAALGDDPNFAATITAQIGAKADASHNHAASEITSGTLDPARLSLTKTQLDTVVSDGNVVYVGDGLNGSLGATTPSTVNYTAARTTEITSTPTGTTQTITLGDGNHQTLSLASTTGNPTITLTVPSSSAAGTLILIQHGTTPRSITWAVSPSGSILWMGGQPTWASDAVSTSRVISWRWNGSVMRLAATEVGA